MNHTFFKRKEFVEYLVSSHDFTKGSAQSYATYIAQVSRIVEGDNFFTHCNELILSGSTLDLGFHINMLLEYLYQKNIDEILGEKLSNIKKWRSALPHYREFLCDLADENDTSWQAETTIDDIEVEAFIKPIVINKVECNREWLFDKDALYNNFTFRIVTQDRHYDKIYFPISFIKRLFYKNDERKFFNDWTKSLIDNIQIHTDDGVVYLKSISSLNIRTESNDIVRNLIVCNGSELPVLSKTALGTIMCMQCERLDMIVIDHEESMKNIMHDSIEFLPTFVLITSKLSKLIKGKASRKKLSAAGSTLIKSENFGADIIEGFKMELNYLLPMFKLQLMDSIENKRKGAN